MARTSGTGADRGQGGRRSTPRQAAAARGLSVEEVGRLATARALSATEVATMPEAVLQRALRRIHYSDLPIAREKFRLLHLQSDDGTVVPNRRVKAVWHQDSLRQRQGVMRVAGVAVGIVASAAALAPPIAGVQPGAWTALGPGNIGGRTRAIVIDPNQPNTMWTGSAGGGIWRTDNAGASWAPVDDLMANLAVCSLAMSPVNSKEIYAGTGEGFSNLDAIRGAGVFWTRDATTWTQIAPTSGFTAVNRLAISADGKTVLAATPNGVYRCSDPARGSWLIVLPGPMADVRFHPTNPLLAVAGSLTVGQAYYSLDGGQTWKTAAHAQPWGGRVELTYALRNPSIVYASVNMSSGTIWRSMDGGKSYKPMKTRAAGNKPANYLGDQGWYANAIWAGDPTNENAVIVGGLDLWRSTDGGDTLTQISLWYSTGSAHADQHCIVNHPGAGPNAKTVFFGNDGGIYRADDFSTVGSDPQHVRGWVALDNSYGVTQFYGGAGNLQSGTIIGGAQDNGTLCYAAGGGQNWQSMFGGDGGWCAADPGDSHYFYGEYVFLNICRSSDGGHTAQYISGQMWNGTRWVWRPPPYQIPDAVTNQALFIAPFLLDPNDSNRILAGGMSLWRTEDAKTPNDDRAMTGPHWISIKNSIGSRISAIAIAGGDSANIWVGYEDGSVFRTANGTNPAPVWQQIGGAGPFPLSVGRYCSSIMIDPQNRQTVYVTYAAYRGSAPAGNVWRTSDGGQTWQDLGHGLPDAPVHKLARHPAHANFLYIGTEVGFLASDDGGTTWSPTNEGPTNCPVYDLFWMNAVLVCATHGRGMFRLQL